MDDEVVRMAALKSLNTSVNSALAAHQLANSLIIQVLMNALEARLGPEFRPLVIRGLKETWEVTAKVAGHDNPIVSDAQDIIQELVNSFEDN